MHRRTVSLWAPVAIYMGLLFFVSSLEQPTIPGGQDKPWHLMGYTGFGVVVARAFAGGLLNPVTMAAAVGSIGLGVGYAVTDELHQMFVPGRSADVLDLVADAIGIVAGTMICWACGIIGPFFRDEL